MRPRRDDISTFKAYTKVMGTEENQRIRNDGDQSPETPEWNQGCRFDSRATEAAMNVPMK